MSRKDKGKKGTEKWDSEDVIQAVVIADSFNFRFLPNHHGKAEGSFAAGQQAAH